MASTQRRKALVIEALGLHYRFIALSRDKFFGIEQVSIEDQLVSITDPSKTVVDGLDHPEYCGGITEMAKALWRYYRSEAVDLERLSAYAFQLGNRTVFKRLGYLAEVLELDMGEYLPQWREAISRGMGLLDPRQGRRGPYNTAWNLRLNVSPGELIEWRRH